MDQRWIEFMRHNHLESIDDVWALPESWIDEPNRGRGGWSGVSRHELKSPGGAMVRVILKRQANYTKRTWLHPLRGISTLRAEAAMIERLCARGVAVPKLIYYGESDGPERRAVLMATELACSESLDRFASMLHLQQAALSKKRKMIFAAAQCAKCISRAVSIGRCFRNTFSCARVIRCRFASSISRSHACGCQCTSARFTISIRSIATRMASA